MKTEEEQPERQKESQKTILKSCGLGLDFAESNREPKSVAN